MIQLTEEQAQAMDEHKEPLQVLNPHNQETYFLIRKDVYEFVRGIIEGPNRRGWDDPELDVYEQYRKKK